MKSLVVASMVLVVVFIFSPATWADMYLGELYTGIFEEDPQSELHISDNQKDGFVQLILQPYGANSDSCIQFREHTAPAMSLYYSGVENELTLYDLTEGAARVTFERDGYVGIGTAAPDALLEVAGSARHHTIRASESPGGPDVGRIEIGYDSSRDYGRIQVWDGDPASPGATDLILSTDGAGSVGIAYGGDKPFPMGSGGYLYFGPSDGPVATLPVEVAGIYANDESSGGPLGMWAFDENGNNTLISPHDPQTGEWIFFSKNVKTGRVVRINMEKLVKKVEEITGEKFMEAWIEGDAKDQDLN